MLDLVRTRFDLLQQDISWTITLTKTALAGDYNRNGVVDAADYIVWRDLFGQSGAELAADGDGNGTVNDGDYDFWSARFGDVDTSAANSLTASVPEVTTSQLLGVLLLFFCGTSRGCSF
jgi:hypothetical protein